MKNYINFFILFLSMLSFPAWADSFVVKKIEIQGLQRISPETVNSYLSIKRGATLSSDKTAAIIKDLYKTGFFEHITLSRQGDTLIIRVVERSTIGQVKITGNSVIPTDKLTTVMKSVDIAEGRVYNRAILDRIKQSLLSQYYELGRYNARVDVTVVPEERNRVLIKIDISEGLVAKVKHINIIGNHAFSKRKLTKQLNVSTSGLLTFFTQSDRYSQEKLESSLDNLRNYYLDRGYIKFVVKSSQVAITPDRKSVYMTVVIDEGALYKVKGFTLTGDLILPRADLMKLVKIKQGDVFSRQTTIDTEKAISDALGNKGYLFAAVSVQPKINETTKDVFLTFHVNPGKRAYVRHIYFSDNSKTNDNVLRREIQQMESSVVSTGKLEESKRRLRLLPYIRDVKMSILPVPNEDDQVDVNYKVTEENTAEVTASLGFSQVDHFIVGAGMNQKNFLGTGNTMGLNFKQSRQQSFYGINYTDPYYTEDGISRSINLSVSKFNSDNANITKGYRTNEFNAAVIYGIPIGHEKDISNSVQLGYGYQSTILDVAASGLSNQITNFINKHGRHYQQIDIILGLSRDGRDRAIFPTAGTIHTLGLDIFLPATKSSLSYLTLGYNTKWYRPLNESFILTARGNLGYGRAMNGGEDFPFFKNFYAGGIESLRGYRGNTVGPRDSTIDHNPTGGNLLVNGSVGLIFPNHVSDNLRTTAFIDAGNVYDTFDNRARYGGTGSGPVRYSMGVEGDWLSPFGMIDISLAKPLNRVPSRNGVPGDNQEIFQFSLGANFG